MRLGVIGIVGNEVGGTCEVKGGDGGIKGLFCFESLDDIGIGPRIAGRYCGGIVGMTSPGFVS